ncbi:MAG: hypothetical protein ACPIOQ_69980, partial [Promethearchaeia archaeon]
PRAHQTPQALPLDAGAAEMEAAVQAAKEFAIRKAKTGNAGVAKRLGTRVPAGVRRTASPSASCEQEGNVTAAGVANKAVLASRRCKNHPRIPSHGS